MRICRDRKNLIFAGFAALMVAASAVVGAPVAEAADARFCKVQDFRVFVYTGANPHYENWVFVQHADHLGYGHKHMWINKYTQKPKTVYCSREPWF